MSLAEVWDTFANGRAPRREVNAAGATTWLNWTQYPDHGPDETLIGDVTGRRVLELGSGSGCNLAHLATKGAASCLGIDVAPSREVIARERWGQRRLPNLAFRTAEATAYLAETTETFDIVLSIFGAAWFIDPAVLLPLVRARMAPGGVLAFSHLPPSNEAADARRAVSRWDHTPAQWNALLAEAGFKNTSAELVPPPLKKHAGTLLMRATVPDERALDG